MEIDATMSNVDITGEGRAVHLDENLVAKFVVAMRIDIDSETKSLQWSKGVDPLPVEEASMAAA
jgi:hypothetical protein